MPTAMILLAVAIWLGVGLVVGLLFTRVARLGASSSDVLRVGLHNDGEHESEPQTMHPATG